jgi:AbiJ N-terminal domain 4
MPLFSQRNGYKPIRDIVQLETMDETLRNAIWNCFCDKIIHSQGFMDRGFSNPGKIHRFGSFFWAKFLKKPSDTCPIGDDAIYDSIRDKFFRFDWFEVYDFVEFITACFHQMPEFVSGINSALESEMSAYRLVQGKIVEITNQTELSAVDSALSQTDFPGASEHLRRALELVSDKQNPDVRNSIKESISAVESAAKSITKKPKATLDEAIKSLEKEGKLHSALKAGFVSLYGYTSDADGIRHAMLGETNLTKADALYFLVTCSAFINYLKSKI